MKEEILSAAISQLKAKVDAIMLDINMMLSMTSEGLADKISGKIVELSIADNALRQATALMAQAMAQRLMAGAESSGTENSDNKTLDEKEGQGE